MVSFMDFDWSVSPPKLAENQLATDLVHTYPTRKFGLV